MKCGNSEYTFAKDKIVNVWLACNKAQILCDNKEIPVKVKGGNTPGSTHKLNFKSDNIVRCALERLEDIVDHLNGMVLKPDYDRKNAFDFIEFVNCEYVAIHCIMKLADVFGANYSSIKNDNKCFGSVERGNASDYDFFEYIRSLCAVHPLETSCHPQVHGFDEFDCCSRIIWDYGKIYGDQRDLSAVIYASKIQHDVHLGLEVSSFVLYLKNWLDFMDDIVVAIENYIRTAKEDFRNIPIKKPEDFSNYLDYIDNLKLEYVKREGFNNYYLFDRYKLAFQIDFSDEKLQRQKECYKNAVVYMFSFLHEQLQEMDERKYTGIVNLQDNEYTSLFLELSSPYVVGSSFANERSAFIYIEHLNSNYESEKLFAREVLKRVMTAVNKYVKFENNESADQTALILQLATYFEALELAGHIKDSIPDEPKYRKY